MTIIRQWADAIIDLYRNAPILVLVVGMGIAVWFLWKDSERIEARCEARISALEKEVRDCQDDQVRIIFKLQERFDTLAARHARIIQNMNKQRRR